MTRIGVLSDTHGYVDEKIKFHLKDCDQIWHAGDIGNIDVLKSLAEITDVTAVYGNIDSIPMRTFAPEIQDFMVENKRILMMHIAGYPGRYQANALQIIKKKKPHIFVCGHSHILKVMNDKSLGHLHINPGAAGKQGMHKVRTLIRFIIDGDKISNLEVVEMGR